MAPITTAVRDQPDQPITPKAAHSVKAAAHRHVSIGKRTHHGHSSIRIVIEPSLGDPPTTISQARPASGTLSGLPTQATLLPRTDRGRRRP